jgi:hypothetical protein
MGEDRSTSAAAPNWDSLAKNGYGSAAQAEGTPVNKSASEQGAPAKVELKGDFKPNND